MCKVHCPFVISKRKTRVGCPTVGLQVHLHLGGVGMGTVVHPGAVDLGVWTCLCRGDAVPAAGVVWVLMEEC